MELTLRKANTLQNTINDTVKAIGLTHLIRVNEFQDAESAVASASAELSTNVHRRVALTDVLYEIRKAVSRANAANGINDMLADVAHLEKEIQLFSGLAAHDVREDAVVLEGKLNRIRNRKDEVRSSLYGAHDDVSTSVLTRREVDLYRARVTADKKKKQKLQDDLLELNVRTTVVLSSRAVDILQHEELV